MPKSIRKSKKPSTRELGTDLAVFAKRLVLLERQHTGLEGAVRHSKQALQDLSKMQAAQVDLIEKLGNDRDRSRITDLETDRDTLIQKTDLARYVATTRELEAELTAMQGKVFALQFIVSFTWVVVFAILMFGLIWGRLS